MATRVEQHLAQPASSTQVVHSRQSLKILSPIGDFAACNAYAENSARFCRIAVSGDRYGLRRCLDLTDYQEGNGRFAWGGESNIAGYSLPALCLPAYSEG
jgi:hypothetical protein